jgi:hypothetical protein
MSDMFWEDDDSAPRESNAMRVLREKAEADSKVIREMAEELKSIRRERDQEKVARVVQSKGLDPKVAALAAAAGVEPSEQAVEAWLGEYGNVFAVKSGQEPTGDGGDEQPPASDVPTAEQAALAAFAAAAQDATEPAKGLGVLSDKIKSASSPEEVLAALGVRDTL